jgi:hypothetical protein
MVSKTRIVLAVLAGLALSVGSVYSADLAAGLKKGTPDLKSAGALAFGPDGILFIGDAQGAAIFAVSTGDTKPASRGELKVEAIDEKIGSLLGTNAKGIKINDLAVNPASGRAYLSVSRGQGPDAVPVIVRVEQGGKLEEVPLKDVPFAKAVLPNASTKQRQMSITKIAFVKDRVFIAGLSNEEWASTLRSVPFPFKDVDKGTGIQIFHGAHGRLETQAPVRTFVPYDIKGESHLLAAYTCTPLVKIPVAQLQPGERVKGVTVAELGNRNNPLDMIVYEKDGKEFLLVANSSRGVMKVPTENFGNAEPINSPVAGGGPAGIGYQTIAELKGVEQLDKLDKDHALILVRTASGLNLDTIAMP